ncbi:hypothetical protein Ddye_002854 [Dipteronia dyeriana]|uniref:RING-type E3 ubiquitin transferase n=1 Tax=Dipteronia dyeriana TaxID=168575 RepID=A0AAD9XRY9_9ROSI|nr:hypothetical protein Ddye_002854 [Dipteronia dyeriana]
MASPSSSKLLFPVSFWFSLLFLFQITKSVENYCPLSICGDNIFPVKFPFQLKNRPTRSSRCVYPGFELSCNSFNNQTILNLPNSGPFRVLFIDYMTQSLRITDPENCFPNRLLQGFSLEGSPFNIEPFLHSFTFLNCSSSATTLTEHHESYRKVSCLSRQNYTVLAGPAEIYYNESTMPSSCVNVSTVPIPWRFRSGIEDDVELVWSRPSCGNCEELGRACVFKNSKSLDTGCSMASFPRFGISRNTKYSIVLGVGIPSLCCMIGLACYLCSWIRAAGERNRFNNTALSTSSIALPPSIILTGLDGPTIESYPKTLLGESKRLPKPNDNTCSICLCEYQAKETLRTIPECNHYFHAHCIDEWLKMKASCPVCRNSPNESSSTSPRSISSSLT